MLLIEDMKGKYVSGTSKLEVIRGIKHQPINRTIHISRKQPRTMIVSFLVRAHIQLWVMLPLNYNIIQRD